MGACDMKNRILLLPIAAMWGCTDYAGQWEDSYGVAFAQGSAPTAQVCAEGATTALSDDKCVTDFLCVNNTWVLQNYVCNGSVQQKICDENATTTVTDGACTSYFVCFNNAWVLIGQPVCTVPLVQSSSSNMVAKSSSSVKRSSSSVARSSSSKTKVSSSSVKRSDSFQTWIGAEGSPQVYTGLDKGGSSGYWFDFNDHEDGGGSMIDWPAPLGNEYAEDAKDAVINFCNGICGTAILEKGVMTYNPFVGVGFNVNVPSASPSAADASSWGGLCITYSSDSAPALELGLGEDVERSIGYANPYAPLSKSSAGTMKNLAWSDFKQPSWYRGDVKIDGKKAASQLFSVKFKIQSSTGKYKFKICAIGPYNGGCPETCI